MTHANGGTRQSTLPTTDSFYDDVIAGLAAPEKSLPCKYLYDAKGCELFDEICNQPEYYLTRCEIDLMKSSLPEMAAVVGPGTALVELGSGSGLKTKLLLEACELEEYVPIDIAGPHLTEVVDQLREQFPQIDIHSVSADFSQPGFLQGVEFSAERRVAYFPGSTIGNFEPAETCDLLHSIRDECGPNSGLLIGLDLVKDVSTMEAAYNDKNGVTEAFILNLLHRIRDELDAQIDPDAFEFLAYYEEEFSRIELYVESKLDQSIEIGDHRFDFEEGERLHIENSHKHDIELFSEIALTCGWRLRKSWTDAKGYFGVLYFDAV